MIHGGRDFTATIFVLAPGGRLQRSVETQEIEQDTTMRGTWSANGNASIDVTTVNSAGMS